MGSKAGEYGKAPPLPQRKLTNAIQNQFIVDLSIYLPQYLS